MKGFFVGCMLLMTVESWSQGISITTDNTPADASAILDVKSNSKGMLIPRMTQANRNLIESPATGLLIYQSDGVPGLYMYNDSAWQVLTTSSNVWSTAGNGGTDPANAFIGTSDSQPLRFRINNAWAGELNFMKSNLSLGDSSGIKQDSFFNTSVGHKSLQLNVNGSRNTAIGYEAMSRNLGSRNTAAGYRALKNNTIGTDNTAFGEKALEFNANGNENTAVGRWALNFNTSGQHNTGIGFGALSTNFHGSDNVVIGYKALFNEPFSTNSVAIGSYAMENHTTGSYDNIAIGYAAMRNDHLGSHNIAIGKEALRGNGMEGLGGYSNIAIGTAVLSEIHTGAFNVGIGYQALKVNSIGFYNTAIGAGTLYNNQAGLKNTAVGTSALGNTVSSYNTAVGSEAMFENTTGVNNTAMGVDALHTNNTGESNTAIGLNALYYNVDGDLNIAIGYNAGTEAGYPNLNNTIGIGNQGTLHTISNQVIIGNSAMAYIGGFEPWTVFSDARMKFDVREDVVGLNFINRLRPVTYYRSVDAPSQITGSTPLPEFSHKYDVEAIRQTGFLAQEVEAAASASGYDFSGVTRPHHASMLYAVSYESFVVPLVKAVQELNGKVDMLHNENQRLALQVERSEIPGIIGKQQAIIQSQEQRITTLEARLAALEATWQGGHNKTD